MKLPRRIKLDIDQEYYNLIPAQQGDTARVLNFQILNNGIPFSLENKTVRARIKKPDGNVCYNDMENINASEGECDLKLTNQILIKPGMCKVQLEIMENGEILSTIIFAIFIRESIDIKDAAESTNEFTALENGIIKLDEWDKYFKETSGQIEQKYTTELNNVKSSLEETKNKVVNLDNSKLEKNVAETTYAKKVELLDKATKEELEVERERINQFTRLQEGSTTGDAELMDIRINSNGIKYSNAGESVRAIGNTLVSPLNMIKELSKNFGLLDYVPVEYTVNTNGYYDKNFHFIPTNASNIELQVSPNEIYKFKVSRNNDLPIYFLVNDTEVLYIENNLTTNYEILEFEIQIPPKCNKLIIQSLDSTGYKYIAKLNKVVVSDIECRQIKNNAITYNLLENGLKNLFIPSYSNVSNLSWTEGCYIKSSGGIVKFDGFSYCKHSVKGGQKYKLSSERRWESCGWVILDDLGNPLSTDNYSTDTPTPFIDEIIIPKNGKYLCFNNNNGSFKYLQLEDTYTPIKQEILYEDLPKQLINNFELIYQILTPSWIDGSYMTQTGAIVTNAGGDYGYAEFDVKEGNVFRITGQKGWGSICYLVKDDNGEVLMHDNRPDDTATKITNEVFTIPKNGTKLYIGKYGFVELYCKNKVVTKEVRSPLEGKKILFNGDSICQGIVNNGGYAKIIKDLTGCIIENRAIGGGTLTSGGTQHKIVEDISNMSAKADLVCFEGGINDYWGKRRLGTITPLNDWTGELDTTTIIGALESIFRQALNKWVGVPICMVFTHPIQTTRWSKMISDGHTMQEQTEALKEVCRKYSIPYVDLMNESGGFNCNLQSIADTYTTDGDGTHPNELGYKRFYVPQILKMFEKLIQID